MVVIGVDDTDSLTAGMCTTWIATEIRRQLPHDSVEAMYLVRLHPAIEHKTRGNGAIAIQTTASTETAHSVSSTVIDEWAAHQDPETNPGLVIAGQAHARSRAFRSVASSAVKTTVALQTVEAILESESIRSQCWGNGRGLIGASAAIGAVGSRIERHAPFTDWTYEWLAYREHARWGNDRDVSLPEREDDNGLPGVWDTIDPVTGELACVPHSPCPVLFGIRGDDPRSVEAFGTAIEGEPQERVQLFCTNQGTDAHLRPGRPGRLEQGHAYQIRGRVIDSPTIPRGGHVSVPIDADGSTLQCLAFAPTGRFRDRVTELVPGDDIVACGEFDTGAIKLEKFALVGPVLAHRVTPVCAECDRSMKSAGRDQGYRCRDGHETAPRKPLATLDRDIERGWYEVPPIARRHLAAPLVRGEYELPVHPTSG